MLNPLFLIPNELRIKIPYYLTASMRVPRSTKKKISRYDPHQGKQEIARRAKQIEKMNMKRAANTAVSSGQSYTIGNRSLTFVNSTEILKNIEFWDSKVRSLTR